MSNEHVVAVMPALNEEQTIGEVISELQRVVDKVIVVDDGSSDGTADIARSEEATVLSHETNLGYDRSIGDGFEMAANHGASVIVTVDADGQHDPADVASVVSPILADEADLVVGRRPDRARLIEALFALYTKPRFGIDDPFSGLKAYDADLYREVGYFDRLDSIGTHLLVSAHKHGFRITQRDIDVKEREDHSRFGRVLAANWMFCKAILRVVRYDLRA